MATISGAAVTPAVASAVNLGNLVNVPAGEPAQERWPSAVDPGQYTDAGPDYAIEGPPAGDWALADVPAGSLPEGAPGGGIQDLSWTTGHDAPTLPWDSSAGAPFAPSGAVDPELHAQDTGAVFVSQYTVPAGVGKISRATTTGQTWNREYAFDPTTGEYVPQPNGRSTLDQQQTWDPHPVDGNVPFYVEYAERPVLLNVAYTATPVTEVMSPQGVSGALPDRSEHAYAASAYEAPPDPVVNQAAAPPASGGGGWMLG